MSRLVNVLDDVEKAADHYHRAKEWGKWTVKRIKEGRGPKDVLRPANLAAHNAREYMKALAVIDIPEGGLVNFRED